MIIKFKYNYKTEFIHKTYSYIYIEGNGEWCVNEDELYEEYRNSDYDDFKEFISNYFYNELDIDPDFITFNEKDFNCLKEYCKYED